MLLRRRAPPVAHPTEAYRREGETLLIVISLSQVQQLYNSFDSSPFQEKDLDDEADRNIFAAAREIGADKPVKLVIHLPAEAAGAPAASWSGSPCSTSRSARSPRRGNRRRGARLCAPFRRLECVRRAHSRAPPSDASSASAGRTAVRPYASALPSRIEGALEP